MAEEHPADPGSKASNEFAGGTSPLSARGGVSETPPRYRRSKRLRNILLVIVALVAVVGGVFFGAT